MRSILLETDILILDEPLNGLDFNAIKIVMNLIVQKTKEGKGIFIISHNEEIFDLLVSEVNIYYLSNK